MEAVDLFLVRFVAGTTQSTGMAHVSIFLG